MNVLLVIENEAYGANLRKICYQLGFHGMLSVAENPGAARLAIQEGEYEVVIVDARLQEPGARRVLELAREWQPGARRIFLTDWSDASPTEISGAMALAHDVWDRAWDIMTLRQRVQLAFREGLFETAPLVPAVA